MRTGVLLLLAVALLAELGCGRQRGGGGGDDDDDTGGDGDADADAGIQPWTDAGADGCPVEWARCDGACVHVLSSSLHCGRCNNACLGGTTCIQGECGNECGNLTLCDGECVDLALSPFNCGACGVVCEADTNCLIGECRGTGIDDIRLVGGGGYDGRVEVSHGGEWGTVCDNGWDNLDAQVVCRMLGYSGGYAYPGGIYPQGVGTIWMADLACVGNEESLEECDFGGWGESNCTHAEDAAIYCDF